MSMRKILALLLAVVMVCSLFVSPALAAEDAGEPVAISDSAAPKFTDVDGHWAESAIVRWAEAGIIEGDGDGTVQPARSLKRAELATILARLLGLKATAPADTFSDVAANAWYADAVLKCAEAGIMLGDGTGKANPEAAIDRQQTIVMVGRALGVKPTTGHSLDRFDDGDTVADWAAPYMIALTDMGILNGLPTGEGDGAIVAPTVNIDRASTFTLLDKAIAQYITAPCTVTVSDADKFVVINSAAEEKGVVTVTGSTAGVVIATGTTDDVVLNRASVGTLKVDAPVNVTINRGSSVTDLDANAAAKIDNKGTVTNLNTNASGVVFDGNKPAKVTTAKDVEPAKDSKGKEVTAQGTVSGGTSGGSSSVVRADLVPAPLHDQAGVIENDADLGKITVTSSRVSGTTNEYNVTIKGERIMNHTSANAGNTDGHWVGFGMPAKVSEDGSTYTYTANGTEISTYAQRVIEVNGKKYNTAYFCEDENGDYGTYKIVVTDGDETVATYNVSFNVTFWSVADADVKVLAAKAETDSIVAKLEESGTPWAHKFADGLGLTAAVSNNTIALTGETTLTALQNTYLGTEGCDGYLTYALQVTDETIKGIKLGNQAADLDELGLDGISLVMNKKIFDGANKEFAAAAKTTFALTDAAGRVQDEVTVTVDASAVTVEGLNKATFVDAEGNIVKALMGETSVTTPAAPAHTDKLYYTGNWVSGETKVAATATYTFGAEKEITFTAEKVDIKDTTLSVRPNGPETNHEPAVEDFHYGEAYKVAGISLSGSEITVDAGKLIAMVNSEDANVQSQLAHIMGNGGEKATQVMFGIAYQTPANAKKVAFAANVAGLASATNYRELATHPSCHEGTLISYIPVAKIVDKEVTFLTEGDSDFCKWVDENNNVVAVTKTVITIAEPTNMPATYTVTFGQTTVKTGFDGKLVEAVPAVPAKAGYTGKWVVDGKEVTTDTVFTADATAEAVYTANSEATFEVMSADVYDLYVAAPGFKENIPAQDAFGSVAVKSVEDGVVALEGELKAITSPWTGFNSVVESEQTGYYLPIMFEAPAAAKNATGTIVSTGKKTFEANALDTIGEGENAKTYFSIFIWLAATKTEDAAAENEITITIDWDGEGGLAATEYTLDLSAVTLKAAETTTPDQGAEASLSAVETEEDVVALAPDAILFDDEETAEIPVMD